MDVTKLLVNEAERGRSKECLRLLRLSAGGLKSVYSISIASKAIPVSIDCRWQHY